MNRRHMGASHSGQLQEAVTLPTLRLRRSESCHAHDDGFRHLLQRDVAQFGSASALGAECRRFKSCHPDLVLRNHYSSIAQRGRAGGR